jgi:hypothetical protein
LFEGSASAFECGLGILDEALGQPEDDSLTDTRNRIAYGLLANLHLLLEFLERYVVKFDS